MKACHTRRCRARALRRGRGDGNPAPYRRIAPAAGPKEFPLAKLSDASYADAAEALGPCAVENKSDPQPGCR